MNARQITGLLVATAVGWMAGGLFRADALPVGSLGSRVANQSGSLLADRALRDGPVRKGELSLQIYRTGKWASEITLVHREAKDAKARIASLEEGTVRDVANFVLYHRWFEKDPGVALGFAIDQDARERIVAELPLDRLVAMVRAEPLIGDELVLAAAMSDPDKALALVDACGLYSNEVSEAIMAGLVSLLGFQGAADRLEEVQSKLFALSGPGSLVKLWAEKDPSAALGWIKDQPGSDSAFWNTLGWASVVGREHPEEALVLAEQLDSPVLRVQTVMRALRGLGKSDVERAFVELGKSDLSDNGRLATADRLVREAAEANPAAALDLLHKFAAEEGFSETSRYVTTRDRNYGQVFSQWASRDLDGAKAYAEGLSDEDARAVAMEAIEDAEGSETD